MIRKRLICKNYEEDFCSNPVGPKGKNRQELRLFKAPEQHIGHFFILKLYFQVINGILLNKRAIFHTDQLKFISRQTFPDIAHSKLYVTRQ